MMVTRKRTDLRILGKINKRKIRKIVLMMLDKNETVDTNGGEDQVMSDTE